MVKILKIPNLKRSNGYMFMILGVLVSIAVVYFTIKIVELSHSNQHSCIYNEPIDVVYTWVNGSDPSFIEELNEHLDGRGGKVDSSQQRYEDKNELRFSLRSLEKFAPWINHVYIVTNGQIPYWLNLDNDKISVVPHNAIFKDKNNLPSFSSPAIESNLHRIPGVSKRFIYFNDDIFIGQPMYLEDFYVANKGFLVYLAYILPSCIKNCPWLYVGDGQCDPACNFEICQFDGGDCIEENKMQKNSEMNNLNTYEQIQSFANNSTKDNLTSMELPKDIWTSVKEKILIEGNTSLEEISMADLVAAHNKRTLDWDKLTKRKKRDALESNKTNDSVKRFSRSAERFDGFLESLLYTQQIFNKKYGFKPRYVPAHAPIFLDRDILLELENTFLMEFEITERNRFRRKEDMQFGFSYYYFLMSESYKRTAANIFDEFDTDSSRTWSDREIRNILTKIYELPLSYETVDHFEGILLNCSESGQYSKVEPPPFERYVDSKLPTISKEMIMECSTLKAFLESKFPNVPKYKHHAVKEAEKYYATFRMLVSNVTNVVIKLDEIRNRMTKFVCLNDNLDGTKPNENELIRAILYDFYLSMFPNPSKFELPEHARNRFLYVNDLNDWRDRHFTIKLILYLTIISLVFLTFFSFLRKGCCIVFTQLFC
ncbi:unnamed protein product [Ceutorhynchus assimilis]|uniref:LNR domain-containing protein n=1 Tax=Ceutorhynchus assimilis TaxID=467358 RepID=A0A9N9QFD5_9CUCU|nr:unnamed protein product [Ceutorhynchus assimilis]